MREARVTAGAAERATPSHTSVPETNARPATLRGDDGTTYRTAVLWLLLLLLTSGLFLYPKHLTLGYAPVESLGVFPHLPLFAALFTLWFATLLALALAPRAGRGPAGMEGLALVGVFAFGYRGVWDVIAPDYWADGLYNIDISRFVRQTGSIAPTHPNLGYLDFPGLHLVAASLADVTRLNMLNVATLLLLTIDLLVAAFLFLIALRILEDVRLATVAALAAMLGNPFYGYWFFYPAFFGLIFVAAFVFLHLRASGSFTAADRLLALLLLATVTISHLVSALALAAILLGVLITVSSARRESYGVTRLLVYAVAPLAWLAFYTLVTFPSIVQMGSQILTNLSESPFFYIATVGRANLGGNQPLWASLTKLAWLALLYVAGTLAALTYAISLRRQARVLVVALGAYLGLLLISVSNTIVSSGGFEFFRILVFAPLITAPVLIKWLWERWAARRALVPAVAGVMLLLAAPSFLVYRAQIAQYVYYPADYAAGRFLGTAVAGRHPQIDSMGFSEDTVLPYKPDAQYLTEGQAVSTSTNATNLFATIDQLTSRFLATNARGRPAYFLYSARPRLQYEHLFGLAPDDRGWLELEQRLNTSNLIYDSGLEQVFESGGP